MSHTMKVLSLAVSSAFMLSSTSWAVPILFPTTGHYYERVDQTGVNWFQAKSASEGMTYLGVPGHLITVTSIEEQQFLVDNLMPPVVSNQRHWIGGFQPPGSPEPDGNWQWVTGEVWGYTNWGVGEPNDSGGLEHSAHIGAQVTWNDFDGNSSFQFDGYYVEYATPEPSSQISLQSSAIYVVRDDNDDAVFDDLGDGTLDLSTKTRTSVGEIDSSGTNQINRIVAKFALPEPPVDTPALKTATLQFFLEDIFGTPAGPMSVFHSAADNDLEMMAADYENPSYGDTLLDLVQPTDAGNLFYELDVTEQVLADYLADGLDPLSAFRLQVNEAVFFEDNASHSYRLTMPGGAANHPELVLTFTAVPEPSTLILAALALLALLAHGHRRRRV